MTRTIQLSISPRQAADLRKVLDPAQFKKAVFQAVSRTTKRAEQIAAKAVLDRLSIPRKYVVGKNRYAAIRHKVSRGDVPEGRVTVRDVALPLSAFDYADSGVVGVSIKIDKQKAPIILRHSFVEKMRSKVQESQGSGHIAVVSRAKISAGSAQSYLDAGSYSKLKTLRNRQVTPDGYAWRLPLKEHFGPSVLTFITFPEIESAVIKNIGNELEKQLDSQVSRFTGGKYSRLSEAVAGLGLSFTDNDSTNPTDA